MSERIPTGTKPPPSGLAHEPGAWLANPENPTQAELAMALKEAARKDPDEVALRRVWSRLAQIQDLVPPRLEVEVTRRVRWPFIAAASLAGAAAAVTFMLLGQSPTAPTPIAAHVPEAVAIPAPRPAPERSALVAPATVRTAAGETLHLALQGGTEVKVTSDSTLVLDEKGRPTVAAGEVVFHVTPQPPGKTFDVRASRFRVVVVGTRFRVRVNGSNASIGVEEGIVEVWDAEARLARLRAGESWVSPSPDTTTAPSGPKAVSAALPSTDSTTARPSAQAPGPSAKRPPVGLRAPMGSHKLRASYNPGGVAASAPSSGANTTLPRGGVSGTSAERTGAPSNAPERAMVVEPVAPPVLAPAPAVVDVVGLVSQARAARSAGDSRRALGLYRSLAQKGGAAGENAEYEIGRLLRDGLHQPREAIAAWRSYRSAHPRGLLRAESDISIIETLVAVSDKGSALTEALDFVRRFPESERRVEMGSLAGDLFRERGDFRGAIAEYDRALENARGRGGSGGLTDAMAFHRSICLLHEDRPAGLTALRGYLQTFPAGRFRGQVERLLEDQGKPSGTRRL